MIKLNLNFEQHLKDQYFTYCYNTFIYKSLSEVVELLPNGYILYNFTELFSEQNIRVLIESSPLKFEEIITNYFEVFPILAERYCYYYLLNKITIQQGCLNLPLTNIKERKSFDIIVANTILELKKLTNLDGLVITKKNIDDLSNSSINRSDKKKILCRLENARRGNSLVTKKYASYFPDWVNEFENIFDYDKMVKYFGYILTQNADLTVCPYCGLEQIQTYNTQQIKIRTDLDHFYPQSRFPFLAISLFNLIPAGWICNQKHKRNSPMLGYMHPCLDSNHDDIIFSFSFIDSSRVKDTLKVIVPKLNDFKDKNMDLFKIQPLYDGSEDLREWYSALHDISNFHKSNGDNLSSIDFTASNWRHTINLNSPSTKVTGQRFKVDAINDLFGTKLTVIEK